MRSIATAFALLLALASAVQPACAQAGGNADSQKQVEELAREAVAKFMAALSLLMQSVPQYEAPYINEQGDIVIRRKHPPAPHPAPAPPAAGDGTHT